MRRSKGPCDNRTDHPLAPKPTVLMRNDINSFCRYPNYNQKLLIRFFTKLVRFLAKPEKRVFMPRPVNNASHQVPSLIREKGWICDHFFWRLSNFLGLGSVFHIKSDRKFSLFPGLKWEPGGWPCLLALAWKLVFWPWLENEPISWKTVLITFGCSWDTYKSY